MSPEERATQLTIDYRAKLISGQRPNLEEMLAEAIKDFQETGADPGPCTEHKNYHGKRTPRSLCEACWRLYIYRKDSN